MSKAYRMSRIMAFLDLAGHRQDIAYQPFQSVMSFGSGGLSGLGLGKGLQVLYLPEAHNDFIAAIIGEELGFVGRGHARRNLPAAGHPRSACGPARPRRLRQLHRLRHLRALRIQALVNMSVAMAIMPTKGTDSSVHQLRAAPRSS